MTPCEQVPHRSGSGHVSNYCNVKDDLGQRVGCGHGSKRERQSRDTTFKVTLSAVNRLAKAPKHVVDSREGLRIGRTRQLTLFNGHNAPYD